MSAVKIGTNDGETGVPIITGDRDYQMRHDALRTTEYNFKAIQKAADITEQIESLIEHKNNFKPLEAVGGIKVKNRTELDSFIHLQYRRLDLCLGLIHVGNKKDLEKILYDCGRKYCQVCDGGKKEDSFTPCEMCFFNYLIECLLIDLI